MRDQPIERVLHLELRVEDDHLGGVRDEVVRLMTDQHVEAGGAERVDARASREVAEEEEEEEEEVGERGWGGEGRGRGRWLERGEARERGEGEEEEVEKERGGGCS